MIQFAIFRWRLSTVYVNTEDHNPSQDKQYSLQSTKPTHRQIPLVHIDLVIGSSLMPGLVTVEGSMVDNGDREEGQKRLSFTFRPLAFAAHRAL